MSIADSAPARHNPAVARPSPFHVPIASPQGRLLASVIALLLAWPAPIASAGGCAFWLDMVRQAHEEQLRMLRPGTTVPWMASDGRSLELNEWRGTSVSLLTERIDYDPWLVKRLLDCLDAYWLRCREICGNTPPPDPTKGPFVKGRAIIAEAVRPASDAPPGQVAERSVPIVAMPGVARVSIGTEALEELLRGFTNGQPSVPLGERLPVAIARTFVFFESELGAATPDRFGPLAGALAFLLAGEVQDSLGWMVPADARQFDAILTAYRNDPQATHATTLAKGIGVSTADAESLWIAMLLPLRHASGERDFMRRVWSTLYECPPAGEADIAVGNLIVSVSAGAKSNLVEAFRALRFEVSATTAARVAEALAPRKIDVQKRRSAPRS
ncbi:MAG: hypothetical protein JNL80_01100 [Phycisphaerae bacterium]|nr:hypothetical protein [Phycisphaerae bacterium]